MNELSNHLKRLIEKSGLTITELAHRAGTNRAYLHDVFRGRFIPTPDRLTAILDALGVDESVRLKTHDLRVRVREETRAKRPSRQNKFLEGLLTKELQVILAENDCPAEAGKSGGADLIVKKNGVACGIFVRSTIPDHHQMLGLALDVMSKAKYKTCFVVVQISSAKDKSYQGLFKKYGVRIVTPDMLVKEFSKERMPQPPEKLIRQINL